jgi:hypothetical protein
MRILSFSEFVGEATVFEDNKAHYKDVKDLDVERPRMAPAPKTDGMTTTTGTGYFKLYIQDEASHVMIDKYGYERGLKNWEGSIGAGSRGGAMYQGAAKIANEKYKMLSELDELSSYGHDYFKESYFSIWKRWKKHTTGKDTPDVTKAEAKKEDEAHAAPKATKAVSPAKPLSGKAKDDAFWEGTKNVTYTDKDTDRIEGIYTRSNGDKDKMMAMARQMAKSIDGWRKAMQRGRAAENENYHDLADVFFARAKELYGVRESEIFDTEDEGTEVL